MQNNKPVIVIDNQLVQLWAYPVYEMALAVARFYLLPVMIIITDRVIILTTSKGNHFVIYENECYIKKHVYLGTSLHVYKLLLWLEHYQMLLTKDMR